jgi:hypothetical protein
MAFGKSRADSIDSAKHIAKRLADYRVKTMAELPSHLRKQLRKEAEDIALNSVFGENHKKDAAGEPIEHGIGSPGNQTRHSLDSFKKYNDMTQLWRAWNVSWRFVKRDGDKKKRRPKNSKSSERLRDDISKQRRARPRPRRA